MLSVTTVNTHLILSPNAFSGLSTRPFRICCTRTAVIKASREQERNHNVVHLHCTMLMTEEGHHLGFFNPRMRSVRDFFWDCGVSNNSGSSVGDSSLEDEILEYMRNSEEPGMFPSKKQLIGAGRMDLVEAIVKEGGWMASGWDLEADEGEGESMDTSYSSASSRSLETAAEDNSGIEGILSRLEIERSMNFGFKLPESREDAHVWGQQHPVYDEPSKTSESPTVPDINGRIDDSQGMPGHFRQCTNVNGLENSVKPDAWRTWHALREESSSIDSEAGDIDAKETRTGNELDTSGTVESHSKHANKNAYCSEARLDPIRTRLQKIESELSAVLNALKSDANTDESHKANESVTGDELSKLNDAWEFRETEIMSQKAKLRTIRAKLAVLEGRQALAVIDAQRLLEQKQKRITDVHKAVQLLRTVSIVWPCNRASEVFLTGSYDGWATQKMEKSISGVFSLNLKLYPGKYEIKFIADGEWKTDPLRPIVNNNGFVNNLLIIQ